MLSAIDHQPTTRASWLLRYNITLAWRGGQCGHSPQHAGASVWAMWAMRLQFHLWAMWAIRFAIAHMTHSLRAGAWGHGGCGSCGQCGHAHQSRRRSTLCTPTRFMRIKLKSHRVRKLYDHFAHRALAPYVYKHLAWAIYPKNHYPKNDPHCPQMNVRKSFTCVSSYDLLHLWVA